MEKDKTVFINTINILFLRWTSTNTVASMDLRYISLVRIFTFSRPYHYCFLCHLKEVSPETLSKIMSPALLYYALKVTE